MMMPKNENSGSQTSGAADAACAKELLNDVGPDAFETPIDYILAEHARHRQVSALLLRAAAGDCDAATAQALKSFLDHSYRRHLAEEELAFFPLLLVRCAPEDGIEQTIAALEKDHRSEERSLGEVLRSLEEIVAGRALSDQAQRRMIYFAEHLRHHLAIENNVVLPIARVRLDERDLHILSEMISKRRSK